MHAAIVTIKNDLHALAVSTAFKNRYGFRCDVIEADCLADTGGLNWSPDDPNAPGVLPNRDGSSVHVASLDVVWWRRFFYNQIALPADVSDPTAIDVITGDCRVSAMGVMLSDFRGAWVSHPDATRRAENKLVQLRAALSAGFRIPKTLVSQNPDRIREFTAAVGGRVVVKSLTNTNHAALTAAVVDSEALRSDRALRLSPAIYQELIPGTRHLRVHGFGDEFHAALITCEQLDWRYHLADATVEEYELPSTVQAALSKVMQTLELRMGVFDLKMTPSGEIVWLEVNPQGQFLFIEGLSQMGITNWLVDFLVREARAQAAAPTTRSKLRTASCQNHALEVAI
jgi:hypothetical protein